jgi:Cys-tRNA synthase (O-phospho-L-seryl-tRNA:Cys-tRNA synthase)
LKAKGILNNDLYQKYKNLRNAVVRLIWKEKANYYTSLLENCDNVWNVLSEIIPTKNSKKKISQQESDCFDAEKLNQHFTTAVAKKANEIELSEESYSALNIDLSLLCGKQFSLPVVDNETVQKRVENLSTKKASGIDNLSVRFLQMLINYICPSNIKYLINCCLRQGVMPQIWKSPKVTALFKSGDKKNMDNFRPISILPAISKVIESVVREDLRHYLLENQLLSQKQFGFRKMILQLMLYCVYKKLL